MNHLVTAVATSVGGVAYGGVVGFGGTTTLTVPGDATTLAYSVNPFQYGDGTPVPRDLLGETVGLPSGNVALHVNNVVGNQPYVAVLLTNSTGLTIQPAIYSGQVQCLGFLPTGASQWYGYYALRSTSEFRYYQNGSGCTGPSRFWSTQQLATYEVDSGRLTLIASVAP